MIRQATIGDLEELIILGWEMHQESSFSRMTYNLERVAESFAMFVEDDGYLFLVSEKKGKVVGGFIGFYHQMWFSDDNVAGDIALFVDPDGRGGMAAAQMIKRFIEWAVDHDVSPCNIQLGITTGVHVEKTASLYEMLGFNRAGLIFNYKGD
jgi:GNAT superfamily N-acetyltransferase